MSILYGPRFLLPIILDVLVTNCIQLVEEERKEFHGGGGQWGAVVTRPVLEVAPITLTLTRLTFHWRELSLKILSNCKGHWEILPGFVPEGGNVH